MTPSAINDDSAFDSKATIYPTKTTESSMNDPYTTIGQKETRNL